MTTQSFLIACCLTLLGVGFYFIPDPVAESVRGTMADILRPGHEAIRLVKESTRINFFADRIAANPDDAGEVRRLTDALAIEQERNRAIQVRLAQLAERHSTDGPISSALSKSTRLILPSLIEVAVLGDSFAEQWRSGKLLDQGSKNGLREHELVLSTRKSKKPLIDLGDDAEISTGDSLLLGRCVIGKIEHVGRWTSTFQLVTDVHYRGRAQLIRETSEGQFVFEAQGILKGQGDALCKLDGIPAENSVHIHDAVYTADRDGILPLPMYYGEVVEATLGTDDREWTILVKPAPLPSRLTTVHVIRTTVNPERLAGK